MKNKEVFNKAVLANNMKEFWEDTLFDTTPEQKKVVREAKYNEAFKDFSSMMSSSKNNGSTRYLTWAINKSLGLSAPAQRSMKISRRK